MRETDKEDIDMKEEALLLCSLLLHCIKSQKTSTTTTKTRAFLIVSYYGLCHGMKSMNKRHGGRKTFFVEKAEENNDEMIVLIL